MSEQASGESSEARPTSVVVCRDCSWKVVTPEPDRDMAGHRAATARRSKHAHASFHVEPHFPGLPTMSRVAALTAGHECCPEVYAAALFAAYTENESR